MVHQLILIHKRLLTGLSIANILQCLLVLDNLLLYSLVLRLVVVSSLDQQMHELLITSRALFTTRVCRFRKLIKQVLISTIDHARLSTHRKGLPLRSS